MGKGLTSFRISKVSTNNIEFIVVEENKWLHQTFSSN